MSAHDPTQRQRSTLQDFFNRAGGFLASKVLRPDAYGVMDVTQEWPLDLVINRFDFTAAVGTNTVVIAEPPEGEHVMIVAASAIIFGVNTNDITFLFTERASLPLLADSFILQAVNLDPTDAPVTGGGVMVGLINTAFTRAGPGAGEFWESRGLGSQYVHSGLRLAFAYTKTAVGLGATFVRTLSLTLPAQQPFSPLLKF